MKSIAYCYIALLVLIAGCRADDPPPHPHDSIQPDLFASPDIPTGCPDPPTLEATVDQYPETTCYSLQPVRGRAPGAKTITAQGGVGAAKPTPVNSDGSFCIEVMLNPDSKNVIALNPIDAAGCPGKNTTITITHETCAQPDAGVTLKNLALEMPVTSNTKPGEGENSFLNDGKSTTVVKYTGGWGISNAEIRVSVALAKPSQIEEIVVRWKDSSGNGCDYATEYLVLYSSVTSAGEPNTNGPWTIIKDVKSGAGGEETYDLSAKKPLAQHVGLILNKNGCTTWSESFILAELEVWGKDPDSVPVPPPDRCQ
jgi:hypothetical protein